MPSADSSHAGPPAEDAAGKLRRALFAPPSRAQLILAVLFFGLGLATVMQVQSTQESALSSARASDLVRILDDLGEQRERLAIEAAELEGTLLELRSGVDADEAARAEARERVESLGILAGTVPAEGPGMVLTITDPNAGVGAADLLDTVQELRDAGAEAIQIGEVRVVGSTSFVDTPEGVSIDNEVVSAPFLVRAIGDPATLSSALAIPGGVLEGLQEAGARPSVAEDGRVQITALSQVRVPEYASPTGG